MEIGVFSKCIKNLIVDHDRVDVPGFGVFYAELIPAGFSDSLTIINPPYRRLYFEKKFVDCSSGDLLFSHISRELNVSRDQAEVELVWCLSRIESELDGNLFCVLPGLGRMKATTRRDYFFVPDDDLDIYPEAFGLKPVCLRQGAASRQMESGAMPAFDEPFRKPSAVSEPLSVSEPVPAAEPLSVAEPAVAAEPVSIAEPVPSEESFSPLPESVSPPPAVSAPLLPELSDAMTGDERDIRRIYEDGSRSRRRKSRRTESYGYQSSHGKPPKSTESKFLTAIMLIVGLVILAIAVMFILPDSIVNPLLYSPQELEIMGQFMR